MLGYSVPRLHKIHFAQCLLPRPVRSVLDSECLLTRQFYANGPASDCVLYGATLTFVLAAPSTLWSVSFICNKALISSVSHLNGVCWAPFPPR